MDSKLLVLKLLAVSEDMPQQRSVPVVADPFEQLAEKLVELLAGLLVAGQ